MPDVIRFIGPLTDSIMKKREKPLKKDYIK